MRKLMYHLSGASTLVLIWRTLLWLFAWPLAYIGYRHRKQEKRHQELLKAVRES